MATYLFHSWGLDFIDPINPPFEGCVWILVAIELFTKWVEVVAMKKVMGCLVANFLRENIICHFGVPSRFIFDNGTPFLNKDVCRLMEWYFRIHTTSTLIIPKEMARLRPPTKGY